MPPTPRSTTTEGLTDEKEAGTGGRAQGGNLCNVPSPKGGDHPTDRELVGAQREKPQIASSPCGSIRAARVQPETLCPITSLAEGRD